MQHDERSDILLSCYMCIFGDKCYFTTLWILIMSHHDLKIFEKYFQPVVDGSKRSEVRLNDRNYQIGDTITLREGVPDAAEEGGFKYTGEEVSAVITFIDDFGCQHGYVSLSLGRVGLTIVHKD